MIAIICGGRDYQFTPQDRDLLDALPITMVFEGGATGADLEGRQWARNTGIPWTTCKADWYPDGSKTLDRSAGPKRNARMLRAAHLSPLQSLPVPPHGEQSPPGTALPAHPRTQPHAHTRSPMGPSRTTQGWTNHMPRAIIMPDHKPHREHTMGKMAIDLEQLETVWGFYLEDQRPQAVRMRCEAAGIRVHKNTLSRWINQGIPNHGVRSFKSRLAEIRETAERVLREKEARRETEQSPRLPGPAQTEIIEPTPARRALVDNLTAQYLADGLEAYQALIDRTILHGHVGLERVMTALMGTSPEDHQAMKNTTTALKNMVSAIRGAVETRATLRGMGVAEGGDAPDAMLMEHFEGWTPDEHRAFREEGVWPESQGPPPAFLMTAAQDPDTDEDPE